MSSLFGFEFATTKDTMAEQLKKFEEENNKARKANDQKKLEYYFDNQKEAVEELLVAQFRRPDKLRFSVNFFNFVRSIIDRTSLVYKEGAIRQIVDDKGEKLDDDQLLFEELEEEMLMNLKMKQVNSLTNLMRKTGTFIGFRNEKMVMDILTPNILDVVVDPEDFTLARAVVWPLTGSSNFMVNVGTEEVTAEVDVNEIEFVYWSAEKHFKFLLSGKMIKVNETNVNPFGILPVTFFSQEPDIDGFFPCGSQYIISQQDTVNLLLTQLNHLIKFQAFSQPVLKGFKGSADIVVDPSIPIKVPPAETGEQEKDFKFETPGSKMLELWDVIKQRINAVEASYNLSPTKFDGDAGQIASGLALKIQNRALLEQREDELIMYKLREMEQFQVIKAVWNARGKERGDTRQFSENARLNINFNEIMFENDPIEELKLGDELIKRGYSNVLTEFRKIDPDLSEEDAKKKIVENREINTEFLASSATQTTNGGAVSLQGRLFQQTPGEPEPTEPIVPEPENV